MLAGKRTIRCLVTDDALTDAVGGNPTQAQKLEWFGHNRSRVEGIASRLFDRGMPTEPQLRCVTRNWRWHAMDKVARMLVAGRRRYARAAKDFPLVHALFALSTFVAVGGKVLAETPDTISSILLDNSTSGRAASFFWNAVAERLPAILRSCSSPGIMVRPIHGMLSHCCRSLSARQYCQDWRARTGSVPMTGQEPCGTWQIRR
jgi:hypothetical protein